MDDDLKQRYYKFQEQFDQIFFSISNPEEVSFLCNRLVQVSRKLICKKHLVEYIEYIWDAFDDHECGECDEERK
jgi:hypothetical protein